MKIQRIYFDMDGVLVDWFGGICDLLQRDRLHEESRWPEGATTEQALQVDVDRMWNLVSRHGCDWWANLDPLPSMRELLVLFADTRAEIGILTSPANCEHAATGKIRWLKQHLPGFVDRVHMTADKHYLARRGVLLIDDHDGNCERFRAAGGTAVLFPQVWNKKRFHCSRQLESVRAQLRYYRVQ